MNKLLETLLKKDRVDIIEEIKNLGVVEAFSGMSAEEIAEVCSQKKIWTPEMSNVLLADRSSANKAISIFSLHTFAVDTDSVLKAIEICDDEIASKYIKANPTIPLDARAAILAANLKKSELYCEILERTPKAFVPKILEGCHALLSKEQLLRIIEVGEGANEESRNQILAEVASFLNSMPEPLSAELITASFNKLGSIPPFVARTKSFETDGLIPWKVILKYDLKTKRPYSKELDLYIRELENEGLLHYFIALSERTINAISDLSKVPQKSPLHLVLNPGYYQNKPTSLTDSQVIVAVNNRDFMRRITGVKVIFENTDLSQFTKCFLQIDASLNYHLSGNKKARIEFSEENTLDFEEKIKLVKVRSAKAYKQLRKVYESVTEQIQKETKSKGGKKKEFFQEMLALFKNSDWRAFYALSSKTGYSVEKFFSDSLQSTKSDERLYRGVYLKKVPKEILFAGESGNENIQRKLGQSIEGSKIILSAAEIKKIPEIMKQADTKYCIENFGDVACLEVLEIKNEDWDICEALDCVNPKEQPKTFKALINAASSKDIGFNVLGSKNLRNFPDDLVSKHVKNSYSAKKLTYKIDGEYAMSDREVLKEVAQTSNCSVESALLELKRGRKDLFNKIKDAYLDGGESIGKLLGVKNYRRNLKLLTTVFDQKEEEAVENTSKKKADPDRARVMGKLRSGRFLEERDLKIVLEIAKEKPSYLDGKEVNSWRDSDGIIDEMIKYTNKKKVKIYQAQNLDQLLHYNFQEKRLPFSEFAKGVLRGVISRQQLRENADVGYFSVSDVLKSEEIFSELMIAGADIKTVINEIKKANDELTKEQVLIALRYCDYLPLESSKEINVFLRVLESFDIALKEAKALAPRNKAISNIEMISRVSGYSGPLVALADLLDQTFQIEDLSGKVSLSSARLTKDRNQQSFAVSYMCGIDSRYESLKMIKYDLGSFKMLLPYEEMVDLIAKDFESFERFFEIPVGLKKNSKFIQSMAPFSSLYGIDTLMKAKIISSYLGSKPSLDLLVDYSDQGNITPSKLSESLEIESLDLVLRESKRIGGLFSPDNQKSKEKIVRSLGELNSRFVRDAINMHERVHSSIDAGLLESQGSDSEESRVAVQSLLALRRSLESLRLRDDVVFVHDRLMKYGNIIKGDAKSPTGLSRYNDEGLRVKSEKIYKGGVEKIKAKELSLYFPRIRGDLVNLGNIHGWCVNTTDSYFEGLQSGNVIVAICAGDPSPENAIALANFEVNRNSKELELEQIRLSDLIGDKREDASPYFNTREILNFINKKRHKVEEEKKRLKEMASSVAPADEDEAA